MNQYLCGLNNLTQHFGIPDIMDNKGVLAIYDTACPKPYAEKTEGAQFQYCGALGREENCNVAVASCFVSQSKHFPVDFKSYLPITTPNPQNFKSKLDLCLRTHR